MLRLLLLTITLALLSLTNLCLEANASMITENTSGGYLAPAWAKDYCVIRGQLYANDGARWYVLRSPQFDRGFIRGAPCVQPERWIVAGGSRMQSFYRTPATFRDQARTPVFCQGQ